MAVFLWSHLIKEYLDVCMSPQNYMNIKDGVGNQRILNIDVLLGVLDTLRLVYFIYDLCVLTREDYTQFDKSPASRTQINLC